MRRWSLMLAGSLAVLATAGWAVQTTQPTQVVVVARRDLVAGYQLQPSDLTLLAEPVGGGRGTHLIPASFQGLVAGEYLSGPVFAGMPVLDNQIHPAARSVPASTQAPGAACDPSEQ